VGCIASSVSAAQGDWEKVPDLRSEKGGFMRRQGALFEAGNWPLIVADAAACLIFFALSLMFFNHAASPAGNGSGSISTAVKSFLSMFVGGAENILDASWVVSRVQPKYPEIAKRMSISGAVEIDVVGDETGKVTEAAAASGPMPLRSAAEAAVKQWKFKAGGGKGKIVINF
jgi:TonB family protein